MYDEDTTTELAARLTHIPPASLHELAADAEPPAVQVQDACISEAERQPAHGPARLEMILRHSGVTVSVEQVAWVLVNRLGRS